RAPVPSNQAAVSGVPEMIGETIGAHVHAEPVHCGRELVPEQLISESSPDVEAGKLPGAWPPRIRGSVGPPGEGSPFRWWACAFWFEVQSVSRATAVDAHDRSVAATMAAQKCLRNMPPHRC